MYEQPRISIIMCVLKDEPYYLSLQDGETNIVPSFNDVKMTFKQIIKNYRSNLNSLTREGDTVALIFSLALEAKNQCNKENSSFCTLQVCNTKVCSEVFSRNLHNSEGFSMDLKM